MGQSVKQAEAQNRHQALLLFKKKNPPKLSCGPEAVAVATVQVISLYLIGPFEEICEVKNGQECSHE